MEPTEPVVSLEHVTHEAELLRVQDLNLEIQPGTALAIIGSLPTAKLELLKLCAGMVPPQAGTIKLFTPPSRIAFLHDAPLFLSNVRFFDNLALPLRYHSDLPEEEIKQRVHEAAERAQIADFNAVSLPMTYPRRFLKRATYARALTMNPQLLVIEEVTNQIDRDDMTWLIELLQYLKASGTSIVYSTRDGALGRDLCDRALTIKSDNVVVDPPS